MIYVIFIFGTVGRSRTYKGDVYNSAPSLKSYNDSFGGLPIPLTTACKLYADISHMSTGIPCALYFDIIHYRSKLIQDSLFIWPQIIVHEHFVRYATLPLVLNFKHCMVVLKSRTQYML